MGLGRIKGWISAQTLSDTPIPPPNPPEAVADPQSHVRQPALNAKFPASRIAALESIWGNGFVAPGGAPEIVRLARPLSLDHTARLLLVGGGIGGPASAVSADCGASVSSFEAEPALAAIAGERYAAAGRSARMQCSTWDKNAPNFACRGSNRALSLEALRGEAPAPLISGLARALSPRGQIVMTELVADLRPPGNDREFAAWCRLENRLPLLPRSEEVSAAFGRQNYRLRTVEDISDRHVAQTLAGWHQTVRGLAGRPRPQVSEAAAFVTEAELWLLRIRLMRRLGMKLMRWHATAAS